MRGGEMRALHLGVMLEGGIGVAADRGCARFCDDLATPSGHRQAIQALRRLLP